MTWLETHNYCPYFNNESDALQLEMRDVSPPAVRSAPAASAPTSTGLSTSAPASEEKKSDPAHAGDVPSGAGGDPKLIDGSSLTAKQRALMDEARSIEHLMTHIPMNPYGH